MRQPVQRVCRNALGRGFSLGRDLPERERRSGLDGTQLRTQSDSVSGHRPVVSRHDLCRAHRKHGWLSFGWRRHQEHRRRRNLERRKYRSANDQRDGPRKHYQHLCGNCRLRHRSVRFRDGLLYFGRYDSQDHRRGRKLDCGGRGAAGRFGHLSDRGGSGQRQDGICRHKRGDGISVARRRRELEGIQCESSECADSVPGDKPT